jgi:hypothetical protein
MYFILIGILLMLNLLLGVAPCGSWHVANVSEDHNASTIRVEVRKVGK